MATAATAPAAPSVCPIDDFVAVTLTSLGVLADERVDGDELGRVALRRARGVGAHEVDRGRVEAALLERAARGPHGARRRRAPAS